MQRRWGRLKWALLLLPLAIFVAVTRTDWPRDQALNFVLGDLAREVSEVDVRYEGKDAEMREVSFRYANEQAPRVVRHEPRLPNGTYGLDIRLQTRSAMARTIQKSITLRGEPISVDISGAMK